MENNWNFINVAMEYLYIKILLTCTVTQKSVFINTEQCLQYFNKWNRITYLIWSNFIKYAWECIIRCLVKIFAEIVVIVLIGG